MPGHWTDQFSFVSGAVRYRDLTYLVLSNDEMAASKTPHSIYVEWDNGSWNNGGRVDWLTAGIAIASHPLEQMAAVGEFGGALLLGSGDRHEEKIGSGKNTPAGRGPLRGIRNIGGRIYAVGMNRQVYRREGPNRWSPQDQGARTDPKTDKVVGFEAIDGFSEEEIYAVGWDGEIWEFDGTNWDQRDSPTNLILLDISCGDGNQAYVCGQAGTLIRGRHDQWETIEQEATKDDFWSSAWFEGHLYLSTMSAVYRLDGTNLQMVDMGEDSPDTCFYLSSGDGVLWSIGAKDIMAYDGIRWTRID